MIVCDYLNMDCFLVHVQYVCVLNWLDGKGSHVVAGQVVYFYVIVNHGRKCFTYYWFLIEADSKVFVCRKMTLFDVMLTMAP